MPVTRDDEGSLRRQRIFEDAIIIRIIHDYVNHTLGMTNAPMLHRTGTAGSWLYSAAG